MKLAFKPDFQEAAERWSAFWKGEGLERPLLAVILPKEGVTPVAKPGYLSGYDGDYERVINQVLAWADTHEFLAEAIPFYQVEFGPDHFSALLGADLHKNPASGDTSWCMPFVDNWDSVEIKFRPDSKWWKQTVEFIRALRAHCDGKLLPTAPTLVAGLDCLAAIRGVENLLLDLITVPDKIKMALQAVCHAYEEIVKAFNVELDYQQNGSITRHGMYSPGIINVPQCDFSCMISPDMFQEFGAPCLQYEASVLDHAEYHLDGPGALKHLEAVCSIPGISVIQWQPGAGEAAQRDWFDLYKRIDRLSTGQILGGNKSRIVSLASELKSPRLFFTAGGLSREEVDELLIELERCWSPLPPA